MLVEYGEQKSQLDLLVIAGSGPSLLGRDWLLAIKLDWSQLHHMTVPSALHKVLQKHTTVFKDELGEVKGTTAKIHVVLVRSGWQVQLSLSRVNPVR